MAEAVGAIYLIGINLWAFVLFGFDKRRARKGGQRVPEARLLWTAFLGGLLGAWTGVVLFRHKTRKTSFRIRLFLVTVINPLWFIAYFLLGWGSEA